MDGSGTLARANKGAFCILLEEMFEPAPLIAIT